MPQMLQFSFEFGTLHPVAKHFQKAALLFSSDNTVCQDILDCDPEIFTRFMIRNEITVYIHPFFQVSDLRLIYDIIADNALYDTIQFIDLGIFRRKIHCQLLCLQQQIISLVIIYNSVFKDLINGLDQLNFLAVKSKVPVLVRPALQPDNLAVINNAVIADAFYNSDQFINASHRIQYSLIFLFTIYNLRMFTLPPDKYNRLYNGFTVSPHGLSSIICIYSYILVAQ